ncbi:MAG: aspartate/glutamate racemase family protein [Gaiellaceae bacterium]|jgi:aspartate racemase
MRTIGLLGGMSFESSLEYYRLLNELVRERLGGLHSARSVMLSVDFAEIELLVREDRWQQAGEVLAEEARRLEGAGAELLALCTNTLHKVAAQIEQAVSIPFVHIADAAAVRVKGAGLRTIGLLGTAYTMEQDFYRRRLEDHGVNVLVPDADDRSEINRIIFEELCLGRIESSSREFFRRAIAELSEQGVEGILLGCTELGSIVRGEDTPLPLFDTTRIHVEAVVEFALGA